MWLHYKATNLLFAKRCAEIYRPGDLIIVHDYHLLLVPKMIRECIGQPSPGVSHAVAGGTLSDGDAASNKHIKGDDGSLGNVGGESRESGEIAIGMFVHTPWPSSEVFRCLPSE
jgi:trehalose 6-phosphate synthase/phosphatase